MIVLYVSLAWLAGAAVGALGWGAWWPAALLGAAGLAIGWVVTGRGRLAAQLGLFLLIALVSLDRYEAALPPAEAQGIAGFNGREGVRFQGTIVTEPEARQASQRFVVAVSAVEEEGGWREIDGQVLVVHRAFPGYAYGDALELTASLEAPPVFDTFDYREYLARRGIFSTTLFPGITVTGEGGGSDLKRAHIALRTPLGDALNRTLPEPEASLARGILLGQRASIPADVNDAFNASGLSHLIAISGYNVMLVAGAVIAAITPFGGRRRAILIAMAVVVAYTAFVGGDPPVVRAMLMALVMLGAVLAGRPGSGLTGVSLAGALMVAVSPRVIEDVSFQLSFVATLGIIVGSAPLRDRFLAHLPERLPAGFRVFVAEQTAVTSAASIAVTPIIAASFGRLSLVALPANIMAAPVFAYALLGAALTAVIGTVDTQAGRLAGEVAYWPIHWLVFLADVWSAMPLATLGAEGWGLGHAAIAYSLIGGAFVVAARTRPERAGEAVSGGLRPAAVVAVVAVLAAGLVWWSALQPAAANLRVVVLDVGQGDAILIESPTGTRVLVDGGPSGPALVQALGEVLPTSSRRIDLMVLTHAQDDHVTGLVEVLRRYDVGGALWNGQAGETAAFAAWEAEIQAQRLPLWVVDAGQRIEIGGSAYLDVLHPQPGGGAEITTDLNNGSVVLRLVYGHVSYLLTGDIEAAGEQALLEAGHDVSATVLKVAHHGSDGGTTPAFLDAVSPQLAIVSAGAGNLFGHPSPTLRLRLAGVPLLRTDLNGNVAVETDGVRVWLEFEHGEISEVEAGVAR